MLAEAITIINAIRPRICQSGYWGVSGFGATGVGEGIINTDVGEVGIRVLVEVAEGKAVEVAVSVKVGVRDGKTPIGMEILPTALAHRL